MKQKKSIIIAFWKAVPDETTMEEMADGIQVTFLYKNHSYMVNTRIDQARTKSFETCYNIWDTKALRAVDHTL